MQSIPACLMRGGTSKGVFFLKQDLPTEHKARDQVLLKIIGSPDPYGKQIDGLGGATSSTSKIVITDKSSREDCDVDYLFGHVAIKEPVIDYSGNCGNLTSAVGVFAIEQGLVENVTSPITAVRVWQENLGQRIVVNVPVDEQGNVVTAGHQSIAGVSGTGAPIQIDFIKPGREDGTVLPTGNVIDTIEIDGESIIATLLYAGNATVFIHEDSLDLSDEESVEAINNNSELLAWVEKIRCAASVKMGLTESLDEAANRPGTPKLAYVAKPRDYTNSESTLIKQNEIDIYARIFSMGKLHHAFTGTGAIALAVAANIEGTLVHSCISTSDNKAIRIGHTAGLFETSAEVQKNNQQWIVKQASMIRTARCLMKGNVYIS